MKEEYGFRQERAMTKRCKKLRLRKSCWGERSLNDLKLAGPFCTTD